jgi:hypothetical protein
MQNFRCSPRVARSARATVIQSGKPGFITAPIETAFAHCAASCGASVAHTSPSLRRGATKYGITKLAAMSVPAMVTVHIFVPGETHEPGNWRQQGSNRCSHPKQDQDRGKRIANECAEPTEERVSAEQGHSLSPALWI